MGLFKSIKKAFKKVGKAIKKVVKKGVSAVKKVAKKVTSSKVLKTLIGAGMIFAGLGGLAGRLATKPGFFQSWGKAASTLVDTKIGAIFRPAYNFTTGVGQGLGPFGGKGPFGFKTPPLSPTGKPMKAPGGVGKFIKDAAGTTATGLISGYAQSELFPNDPQSNPAGLSVEPDERLAPVEFAYQNLGINASDAYSNLTYGREDLGYISQPLYQQETLQVG
jgi:hypothetical protein